MNDKEMWEVMCKERFDKLERKAELNHDLLTKLGKDMDLILAIRKWVITTLSALALGIIAKLIWAFLQYWESIKHHIGQ
jgi:hypothetical protein